MNPGIWLGGQACRAWMCITPGITRGRRISTTLSTPEGLNIGWLWVYRAFKAPPQVRRGLLITGMFFCWGPVSIWVLFNPFRVAGGGRRSLCHGFHPRLLLLKPFRLLWG